MRDPLAGDLAEFWRELRRRHVVRAALTYAIVGWAVIQVADTVLPRLLDDSGLADPAVKVVIVLVALAFPLVLVLAWAFEITPDGMRRVEEPAAGAAAATPAPPIGSGVPVRRIYPAPRRPVPERAPARAEPAEEPAPAGEAEVRRASLASLRHELRTPLNAILGYSEMLVEDGQEEMPAERVQQLRAVNGAGKRLLVLIDEMLRPASSAEELDDAAIRELRERARTALSGPVRALREASGNIRDAARSAADAAQVPDLERIADAARRLAEMVEELGTPAAADASTAVRYAQTRQVAERVMARIRPGAHPSPPRHGHLLVVDDNAMNRDLLSRQLARQGYSVDTASDGREALEILRSRDFDVVLLDVLMPGLDGIQVLDQIQRDPRLADIPVIMISALDEIEGVVRCIERGAVDYLSKPFDPVLLQARVGTTLEVRRLREQERRAAESLDAEAAWSDRLARSFLPAGVAARARDGRNGIAELHPDVVVVAVELDGLGTLAVRGGPARAVERMRALAAALEGTAAGFPVETYWVGGRIFLALAGCDGAERTDHAELAADLALRLADEVAGWAGGEEPVRAGIGLHAGVMAAGLTGEERIVFGLWGEAVELAQGLARVASPGEVQVSPAAYARLYSAFDFESRGVLQVTDRGQMRVYRLTGRKHVPA